MLCPHYLYNLIINFHMKLCKLSDLTRPQDIHDDRVNVRMHALLNNLCTGLEVLVPVHGSIVLFVSLVHNKLSRNNIATLYHPMN